MEKFKRDKDFEAIFVIAWQAARAVLARDWRRAAAVALAPGIAVLFVWSPPAGAPVAPFGLVYLAVVAVALSWYLRACLAALDPGARGVSVALARHVWRVAAAWGLTLVPAIWLFAMVEGGAVDPVSFVFLLAILATLGLTFFMFTLGAATSARVAATGRFSPLETWAILKGRRFASFLSLFLVLAVALGGGGFLFLPSVALEALGLPWWAAGLPGAVLAHLVLLLGLAAVATAVHDCATAPPAEGLSAPP